MHHEKSNPLIPLSSQLPVLPNNDQDKILELEKVLCEKDDEISRLNKNLIEKAKEFEKLRNILSEKGNEVLKLNSTLHEQKVDILRLKSVLQERDKEIKKLNKLLSEKEEEIKKLREFLKPTHPSPSAKRFVSVIFEKGDKKRYDYFLKDSDNVKVGDFVEVYALDKRSGKSKWNVVKVLL